jgi:hypothetical protein
MKIGSILPRGIIASTAFKVPIRFPCAMSGALLAAWARKTRETEAAGALAGAPMQTGLLELAGILLMLTEISFEAILTQALELIFTCGHACGTIPTGLALTWGAVIALPNTLAAQEAVGEVQPLAIHRHLAHTAAEVGADIGGWGQLYRRLHTAQVEQGV